MNEDEVAGGSDEYDALSLLKKMTATMYWW
jgi:hypothetical protein